MTCVQGTRITFWAWAGILLCLWAPQPAWAAKDAADASYQQAVQQAAAAEDKAHIALQAARQAYTQAQDSGQEETAEQLVVYVRKAEKAYSRTQNGTAQVQELTAMAKQAPSQEQAQACAAMAEAIAATSGIWAESTLNYSQAASLTLTGEDEQASAQAKLGESNTENAQALNVQIASAEDSFADGDFSMAAMQAGQAASTAAQSLARAQTGSEDITGAGPGGVAGGGPVDPGEVVAATPAAETGFTVPTTPDFDDLGPDDEPVSGE